MTITFWQALARRDVVLAWGVKGRLLDRGRHILSLLPAAYCLGVTKDGNPKHPLYLAGGTPVRPFLSLHGHIRSCSHPALPLSNPDFSGLCVAIA